MMNDNNNGRMRDDSYELQYLTHELVKITLQFSTWKYMMMMMMMMMSLQLWIVMSQENQDHQVGSHDDGIISMMHWNPHWQCFVKPDCGFCATNATGTFCCRCFPI